MINKCTAQGDFVHILAFFLQYPVQAGEIRAGHIAANQLNLTLPFGHVIFLLICFCEKYGIKGRFGRGQIHLDRAKLTKTVL